VYACVRVCVCLCVHVSVSYVYLFCIYQTVVICYDVYTMFILYIIFVGRIPSWSYSTANVKMPCFSVSFSFQNRVQTVLKNRLQTV
jgi:hypothetical protein